MNAQNKELQAVESKPPAELIQIAVQSGADLDKLEKVLNIQRQWETDQARKAYNKAMADFKADPPKIFKDKVVGFETKQNGKVGYSHASLGNITEKISASLSKHGLSASWRVAQNGKVSVTTRIAHVLGHFEETTITAAEDTSGSKNSIQAVGSTITYLERYGLLALTGLATYDQDDDGAGDVEYITDSQAADIRALMQEVKADEKAFLKYMGGIESVEKMPKSQYQKAIAGLESKRKPKPSAQGGSR